MSENMIAVIIGIVEGLTEFLPISSTGHMILAGALLGFEGEKASVFEVFIQLGAILSVLILYRDKFALMVKPNRLQSGSSLSLFHIAAGVVPVMGVGYLFHKMIKTYLFSPLTVIAGLIAGALLMLFAEKTTAQRPLVKDVDKITLRQAFFVGLFQILSLWPGFSRSGSTIAGGLFFGIDRRAAAEFSFIIAVPLMAVACLYDLLKLWSKLDAVDLQMFAIGFGTAFLVAYLSIVWFLKFLNKSTLASFAYYRFILAAISYYYFFGR